MTPDALRTRRLELDQPGEADIDAIAEYCRDPLFERFLTTPWPYERAHAEGFVRDHAPRGWATGAEHTWAIRVRGDRRLLGVVGARSARRDIGYWLGAPHRGLGFATEAVGAVVDWLFEVADWPEVTWEAVAGNAASAGVVRALGFRYTGEGPVRLPFRDGSHPAGWHAVLARGDDRSPRTGWPS